MKPTQQQGRLKKQFILSAITITSMEISYRLPHIWFPALKLKGGLEVNTSFNQNEETNNQSQASSVSTQVRPQCIKSAGQSSLFAK